MAQNGKLGIRATEVFEQDGITYVRYHTTCVVVFDVMTIALDSGGWKTATTKNRMNQASNEFDLGFYVFQKHFDWFVEYQGETILFEDGMILTRRIAT